MKKLFIDLLSNNINILYLKNIKDFNAIDVTDNLFELFYNPNIDYFTLNNLIYSAIDVYHNNVCAQLKYNFLKVYCIKEYVTISVNCLDTKVIFDLEEFADDGWFTENNKTDLLELKYSLEHFLNEE